MHPGLDGLSIPKVESAAQVREIVARVERLEHVGLASRSIPSG